MKNFFLNVSRKFALWMYGRNGLDPLNMFIAVIALVLSFASNFRKLWFLSPLSSICIVFFIIRFVSKNLYKRRAENAKYLEIKNKIVGKAPTYKKMWQDRNTHKYFKCPSCKTTLRVPRGRGKIEITCPKCQTKIIKNT